MLISGGSRISPRRGRQLSGGAPTYDFAKFSQKLHEIERIWTPGGGRASKILLCRSATADHVQHISDTYTGVASLMSVTTTVTRTVVDIAAGSVP